ncbi:hypothetical protein JKP88DRAFT_257596 [Tribonema minus]|uniref:Uncharacterized protein n=1 Tax=Tribonema minus TaxID=303371 RepID=A0A835Z190_9STRA|nr:hypothetical protein JKP88DRAFT_257596 [Tribonema minus]
MRVPRNWTNRTACEVLTSPGWPLAYSKYSAQMYEDKGRVNSNLQDMRHECARPGMQSKCRICEDIACGANNTCSCPFQLQGTNYSALSVNIPTVSDTPWAVGGSHRNDFAGVNTTHTCLMLSGGHCTDPTTSTTDFSSCPVRCWGYNAPSPPLRTAPVDLAPRLQVPAPNASAALLDPSVWTYTASDVWSYASTLQTAYTPSVPAFNPQGYLFTLAGGGAAGGAGAGAGGGLPGYADGVGAAARFNAPHDVAADAAGNIYVADTGNNRIRRVDAAGAVTTVAGDGSAGAADGAALGASFSSPTGIAVGYRNGTAEVLLYVADRANHRVRVVDVAAGTVACYAGRCGHAPQPGFGDGAPDIARFDAPTGLALDRDTGHLYVADTNNHVVRLVSGGGGGSGGSGGGGGAAGVYTVAGALAPAARTASERASCPAPCLQGVPGHADGAVLDGAQFYYPTDVDIMPSGELVVAERHAIRLISLPGDDPSVSFGIGSQGRVSTLAGAGDEEGERDGEGSGVARFNGPAGVAVTADNITFMADSTSCRIRRLSPAASVALSMTCATRLIDVVRPSGCSSYDPPTDDRDKTVGAVYGHVHYNLATYGSLNDAIDGREVAGRQIKQCVGSPPVDVLDTAAARALIGQVIDDGRAVVKEDTGDGTVLRLRCPSGCAAAAAAAVYGGGDAAQSYSDDSSVCRAAVQAGALNDTTGGYISVTLRRGASAAGVAAAATSAHGVGSAGGVAASHPRLFTVAPYNEVSDLATAAAAATAAQSAITVETIAGRAAASLEAGCGFADAQPPQAAALRAPAGVDVWRSTAATAALGAPSPAFVFIADTGNHAIRALSAACAAPCENGGACTGGGGGAGWGVCACAPGWGGVDCTTPQCSTPCGARQVCIAPNTCACAPGYGDVAAGCATPLCAQQCSNGGRCAAPDACACAPGWFGPSCEAPVCAQTCGNGGNCTAPDTCACAAQWGGADCRAPVCAQRCLNGGWCTAPDTCTCPPQWTGHDCALPVCSQGYFAPAPPPAGRPAHWARYAACNTTAWCNTTDGFDCAQPRRTYAPAPDCLMLELSADAISPFPYLQGANASTPYMRYSALSPYNASDAPGAPWCPPPAGAANATAPWGGAPDRQVALVTRLDAAEGMYVCANGGACVAPDVCACARGWAGFDCRVPVCGDGYYVAAQDAFVKGTGNPDDVTPFERFLDPNHGGALRQRGNYSNPSYAVNTEYFNNGSSVTRNFTARGGARYLALPPAGAAALAGSYSVTVSGGGSYNVTAAGNVSVAGVNLTVAYQGGYRCSIRAWTDFENATFVSNLTNFWSRYMDTATQGDGRVYTAWGTDLLWPPTHWHTALLEVANATAGGAAAAAPTYVYTDYGYMRPGVWQTTGAPWQPGVCVVEFRRNCTALGGSGIGRGGTRKDVDLVSGRGGVLVQDTDAAYRMRVSYTDAREVAQGRWWEEGGECVDQVVRGCRNNGTCALPGVCECAPGWSGPDCSDPVCGQRCANGGNCTLPDTCTCSRGWAGPNCTTPLCAQDCNNGGVCVAPDVCKCKQWAADWPDGRLAGGRPLFRKPNGDPQTTGWTGYDCATPICTQASTFALVHSPQQVSLGGHGPDGLLACSAVRCPLYDAAYVTTAGASFQSGCGADPRGTGCCVAETAPGTGARTGRWQCSRCLRPIAAPHNLTCAAADMESKWYAAAANVPAAYLDDGAVRACGARHSPFPYYVDATPGRDAALFSPDLALSNATGPQFLCGVAAWEQGTFDGAAAEDAAAVANGTGTDFALEAGRHVRVNFPNYRQVSPDVWEQGLSLVRGEGVYVCANNGSCIAPDTCTCADGWGGFDCQTPLCRHLQPSGAVSACQNGGVCANKDDCRCAQAESVLWKVYPDAVRGRTGWGGTDCSMPMCVQGHFDPFCGGLPQAPGGEGCFRCANGGNCTAPDVCACAPGWAGYDCRTPVCEAVADALTRVALDTVDEEKVHAFESDPCSMRALHQPHLWDGAWYTRGNCTAPNRCTCTCWEAHSPQACAARKEGCEGPWQDPLVRYRNALPVGAMFGTRACISGFEGLADAEDRFTTCHMTIHVPSWVQRQSIPLIIGGVFLGFFGSIVYLLVRRRLRRRYLRAKMERRRSRRSSDTAGLLRGASR